MGVNAKVVIGWIIIVVGLAIIGQAINSSYQYFTAKADFPQVFKQPASQAAPTAPTETNLGNLSPEQEQALMQNQIQQSVGQAVGNILPEGGLAKLLNIIVWVMFATFLAFAGAKLAAVGIKLIVAK